MPKKNILLIPTWFPTEKNPHNGSFFREQAIVLSQEFNVSVLLIHFNSSLKIRNYSFSFVKKDNDLNIYSLIIKKYKNPVKGFLYNLIKCHFFSKKEGIGYYELPSYQKKQEKLFKKLKSQNKLPYFDCIYGLTAQDNATICEQLAKVYNVPYVLAEHGPFPWPGSIISDKTIQAIENSNSFFAISNDKIRQILLQNISVKSYYVGNYCDETKFKFIKNNNNEKTFLIVAANSFYKNYPMFIKTMEELKNIAIQPFRIIIAGYGANAGYSKNSDTLEEVVKQSNFFDIVEMIPSISREEIPSLYNRSDAFVMTSIQEGLPISALEASMSGLPVFSTRCGGVEDYVDESMGRIVQITDYKALANVCNDFLNGNITFDNEAIRNKTISLFGCYAFKERMSKEFYRVIDDFNKKTEET